MLLLGTPSELDSIVTFNVGSYRCTSAMAELKSALADSAVDTTLAPELDPAELPASEMLSELSTSTAVAAFALCLYPPVWPLVSRNLGMFISLPGVAHS